MFVTMTYREAKQIIRARIQTWSDEKLAHVYAHNQDGRMSYSDACNCLVGVDSSSRLHVGCRDAYGVCSGHYNAAMLEPGMRELQSAYFNLGPGGELRCLRLSAILRAQMRLRDRRMIDTVMQYATA